MKKCFLIVNIVEDDDWERHDVPVAVFLTRESAVSWLSSHEYEPEDEGSNRFVRTWMPEYAGTMAIRPIDLFE